MSLDLLEELLGRGLRATVRARGGSMWPALRDGDVLTLQPLPPSRASGHRAVLAVRCGDALVIHRAVARRGDAVVLRGDANPAPDGAFPLTAILGEVVAVRRDGRPVRLSSGRLAGVLRFVRRVRALRLPRALRLVRAAPAVGVAGPAPAVRLAGPAPALRLAGPAVPAAAVRAGPAPW